MGLEEKLYVAYVYPVVLREIANLIEDGREEEVNIEILEEIVEYLRQKQSK